MGVADGPLDGGEVVLVVADGHVAVDGILWVGALSEYEQNFLVDLQEGSASDSHLCHLNSRVCVPRIHQTQIALAVHTERLQAWLWVRFLHPVRACPSDCQYDSFSVRQYTHNKAVSVALRTRQSRARVRRHRWRGGAICPIQSGKMTARLGFLRRECCRRRGLVDP